MSTCSSKVCDEVKARHKEYLALQNAPKASAFFPHLHEQVDAEAERIKEMTARLKATERIRTFEKRDGMRSKVRTAREAAERAEQVAAEDLALEPHRAIANEELEQVIPDGPSLAELRGALAAGRVRPERSPRWDEKWW